MTLKVTDFTNGINLSDLIDNARFRCCACRKVRRQITTAGHLPGANTMSNLLNATALCIAVMTSVPSLASPYVGVFKAVITSGTFEENDHGCQCLVATDLTGQTVSVEFRVTAFASFVIDEDLVPAGAFGRGSIKDPLFSIIVEGSSNPHDGHFPLFDENASFSGDSTSGAVSFDNSDEYDGARYLTLSYYGAKQFDGPVTGTGSAGEFLNESFYGGYLQDTLTTVSFDLISGRVQAVPEPSVWAMMVVGFGITGAVVRRRVRRHLPALYYR